MENNTLNKSQMDEFIRLYRQDLVSGERIFEIPVSALQPDPNQPRKTLRDPANYPEIGELAASIKEHGVLEPVLFRTVSPEETDQTPTLYIVAGARRWLAAQMAGLETIPARYVDGNEIELGLSENLIRQDLTAVEEAEAMQHWIDQKGMKQVDLAKKIGKSTAAVSESLALMDLPQEIRDDCRGDRTVAKSLLLRLAKMKNKDKMLEAWRKIREKAPSAPSTSGTEKPPKKGTVDYFQRKIQKLLEEVISFDPGGWKKEDKDALIQTFEDAVTKARAHMNPIEEAA